MTRISKIKTASLFSQAIFNAVGGGYMRTIAKYAIERSAGYFTQNLLLSFKSSSSFFSSMICSLRWISSSDSS